MGAISEAAAKEDTAAMLRAMRAELAKQLDDGVPARELASVSKRLMEIHKELQALKAAEETEEKSKSGAEEEAF